MGLSSIVRENKINYIHHWDGLQELRKVKLQGGIGGDSETKFFIIELLGLARLRNRSGKAGIHVASGS